MMLIWRWTMRGTQTLVVLLLHCAGSRIMTGIMQHQWHLMTAIVCPINDVNDRVKTWWPGTNLTINSWVCSGIGIDDRRFLLKDHRHRLYILVMLIELVAHCLQSWLVMTNWIWRNTISTSGKSNPYLLILYYSFYLKHIMIIPFLAKITKSILKVDGCCWQSLECWAQGPDLMISRVLQVLSQKLPGTISLQIIFI